MDAPLLALTLRRFHSRAGQSSLAADTENMRQLVHLRWIAVSGQLLTILTVAYVMHVPIPVAPMMATLAVAALINVATTFIVRRHRINHVQLLLALLFDVGSLTVQLYLSGGSTNPFISLYLLQVVLGAILLERWATWIIVVVTSLSFELLTIHHRPLRYPVDLLPDVGGLYTLGSWMCFVLVGTLLVLFVTRVIHNLRMRDAALGDLRQQASEEDHLVRMGLFASGAAHELGTPLATLSVILGDWKRMARLAADPELMGEIAEMQAEVLRCKAIVTGILHSVGELPGGPPEHIEVPEFLADVIGQWRVLHPEVRLAFDDHTTGDDTIPADPALRQAVWNVLDNAVETSTADCRVVAETRDETLVLTVRDRGPGFPAAVLADFGRPHRSSKGSGHGVGLFLVASVVRRLGGTVTAVNRADGGADVTIALPLAGRRP